jgi:two-component system chemotaxis response regulator CheY
VAKKIILVDDSKTILATAEMALDDLVNSGVITLKTYLNPAELRDELLAGREDYDLLISDINMPQLNGLDLASELKQNASFKNKPILILTTESSAEMKAKGKSIGVTGWLVKPFSDQKLVKAMKMVLGL